MRLRAYRVRFRFIGLGFVAVSVVGFLLAIESALWSAECLRSAALSTDLFLSCDPGPDVWSVVHLLVFGVGGLLIALVRLPAARADRLGSRRREGR